MLRLTLTLALLIPGCNRPSTQAAPPTAPPGPAPTKPAKPDKPGPGQVLLDGELHTVRWDDGDTFSYKGAAEKVRARLADYNTLESYGPVHRWRGAGYDELYANAKQATARVRAGGWSCQRTGKGGGYGRIGVRCPDAALALVSEGLAHVFSVEEPADSKLLEAQKAAIAGKRGMWAKGAPEGIVTSLHSKDEPGRAKPGQLYDRVASASTGAARPTPHDQTYAACQEVCRQGSCMRYIPFKQRYGKDRLRCPAGP